MAHGYLSYQDTRGEAFFLGDVIKAVKKYLDQREEKEKVADMIATKVEILNDKPALPSAAETPLLKGGSSKELAGSPLQKMLGGTVLQRSLPGGAAAVNPEVMGGGLARSSAFNARPLRPEGFASDAIVNIGATDLGVERDLPGDDMFVKRMGPVDNDQGEVVQAIDRLTFVTMSLVQATKEQTNSQKQIAAAQQQQAEQLARNAKASAEENFLEKGADFSSNIAYERSMLAAGTGMIGRRGGGGGPGMGIGGKIMAKRMLSAAGRRGAGRMGTRLGAALGGKMLGGLGKKAGAKLGGKAIGKVAGGAIAKSLGKKIPLVGLGLGAVFAAQRAMQGDFLGAGLELASGAASTVPGIGTAGSIGIDAALAARDMTMMADGGIVDGATNAILGEEGKEAVFPLEGSRGKKTFLQFGEGILEAQQKNKVKFAKLQALGLKEFFSKGESGGGFNLLGMLRNFIPGLPRDPNASGGRQYLDMDLENIDVDATKASGVLGRVLPTSVGQLPPTITKDSTGKNPISNFGQFRQYYNSGAGGYHEGSDIGMDAGSPVINIQKGKVVDAYNTGFGKYGGAAVVEHEDGSQFVYGHITPSVSVGDEVGVGAELGKLVFYPSPDGKSDYTHLHLERLQSDGTKIDPIKWMMQNEAIDPSKLEPVETKADPSTTSEQVKSQVQGLTGLMSNASTEGSQKVDGVGTFTRTQSGTRKGIASYESIYRDTEGNLITPEQFQQKLNAVKKKFDISSITPTNTETGSALSTASTETAANNNGGTTVINNNVTTSGTQTASAQAGDVPFGSSKDSMGLTHMSRMYTQALG
tara:strand:- start:5697 stop:8132 length:2436 start_codon:yes stop_codon:yes gene_type:complete